MIDLKGQKFHRLTVLHREGSRNGHALWLCLCECGNYKYATTGKLRYGDVKSCGCLFKETITTHGNSKGGGCTRAYKIWAGMKGRCYNPKSTGYKNYGGRGIKVCDRWLESFENFLEDMGEPPSEKTLDRIDNDGHYSPENCKWSTKTEQGLNTSRNVYLTHGGLTKTISQWCEVYDLKPNTVSTRKAKGWTDDECLFGKDLYNKGSLSKGER